MKTFNFKLKSMFFALILTSSFVLYAQKEATNANLTHQQKEWFLNKSWLQNANVSYDPSLDVETFVKHYEKHPERWNIVFQFIHDNDLANLPLGKQILNEDVNVNVQEYTTKEPGKELLEGHKKYIDLQFIVSGVELHGYAKLSEACDTIMSYTEKDDIALYKVPSITFHAIKPNHFTIFFPDDIHTTNIQYGEKTPVRKVVFKIKVD